MVKKLSVAALLAASTMLSTGAANAAFINGAMGAGNGFSGVSNIPALPTSTLLQNTISFNPGSGSGNGNFGIVANVQPSNVLNAITGPTTFSFTFGVFTFTASTFSGISVTPFGCTNSGIGGESCNQQYSFSMTGTVDDGVGGLDPTAFSGSFSVSATCSDNSRDNTCNAGGFTSSSWQLTASASGQTPTPPPPPPPTTTPEPASLALLGAALAGLGIVRRRRA